MYYVYSYIITCSIKVWHHSFRHPFAHKLLHFLHWGINGSTRYMWGMVQSWSLLDASWTDVRTCYFIGVALFMAVWYSLLLWSKMLWFSLTAWPGRQIWEGAWDSMRIVKEELRLYKTTPTVPERDLFCFAPLTQMPEFESWLCVFVVHWATGYHQAFLVSFCPKTCETDKSLENVHSVLLSFIMASYSQPRNIFD